MAHTERSMHSTATVRSRWLESRAAALRPGERRPDTREWYEQFVTNGLRRVRDAEGARQRRGAEDDEQTRVWASGAEMAPLFVQLVERFGASAAAEQLEVTERHLRRLVGGEVNRVPLQLVDVVTTRLGLGLYSCGLTLHETKRRAGATAS